MKALSYILTLSTALAAAAFTAPALADTVTTTKTVTQQSQIPPGSRPINFADFDMNKDSILSTREVGAMLFTLFDTDNNNVIDEKEYESRTILTVVPMQKETTITYDYDNDGVADKTQSTYETFTENTQLSLFGKNPNGLSPHELVEKTFATADVDTSGGIDRTEWRNAYIFKITPLPVNN